MKKGGVDKPKDVHSIEIALKGKEKSNNGSDNANTSLRKNLPLNLPSIIEHEYAAKYLELMGAYPTSGNIEYLLDNMPISEGLIVPIWSRECIVVVPCMSMKEAESTNLMDKLMNTKAVENDTNKKKDNNNKTLKNTESEADSQQQREEDKLRIKIELQEKLSKEITEGRRLSWCTVNTLADTKPAVLIEALGKEEIASSNFLQMMDPLKFTEQQILNPISKFTVRLTEFLPRLIKEKSDRMHRSMMRVLTSNATIKLYGLMCHFCYWNIIHPCVRKAILLLKEVDPTALDKRRDIEENLEFYESLDGSSYVSCDGDISLSSNTSLNNRDKEGIFVHLETCLTKLQKIMGYNVFALTTGYQGLISCCHFVVDDVLSNVYPWLHATVPKNNEVHDKTRSIGNLRLELKRLCHQSLTDLIDPTKVYTSSMLHSSNIPSVKHVDNKGMGRFYCTSMATKAVFSDATDNEIRKLLSMNTNKTYVRVPGVNNISHNNDSNQFLSPIRKTTGNFFDDNVSVQEKVQKIQSQSPILSPDKNLLQHLKNVRSLKERKIGIKLNSADLFGDSFYDMKHLEASSSYDSLQRSKSYSMVNFSEDIDEEVMKKQRPKLDFKNLMGKKTATNNDKTNANDNVNNAKEKYKTIVDEIMSADVKSIKLNNTAEDNESIATMTTQDTLLVSNKKTDIPISLSGKAVLINLLTDRTSQHYNQKDKLSEKRKNLITQKR